MKIILTSLFSLMLTAAIAQPCANCNTIGKLDIKISTIDKGLKLFYNRGLDTVQRNDICNLITLELIPALVFEDEKTFELHLAMITTVETITWLELIMQERIKEVENSIASTHYYSDINPVLYKKRLAQINDRMDEIFEREITFYRFTDHSDKWVKAIYGEHGNDILSIRSRYNDDRDMTGSFRLEIVTDQFKLRLFSGKSWWNFNSRSWYSYQTIFMGGEGYTPYLRDTSIFNSPTAVDSNDRPFASFVYFGLSKHRMYRKGTFKMTSYFKFGTIGSDKPNGIQSFIHRDLSVGSYTPNGWDAQIAAGGRFGFQYDLSHEYMLLSKNWLLTSSIRNKFENRLEYFPRWINISAFDEIRAGYEMSSLGGGLRISTTDFKRSGDYGIPISGSKKLLNSDPNNFAISLNYSFKVRYVFHNSMLEGYGIFKKPLIDEDPNTPTDAYVLTNNQMERLVYAHEFTIGLKFRYVSVIYKNLFMSPEYNLPVNSITYPFGDPDFSTGANHNTHPWNYVGTVGLLFTIK